MDAFQEQRRGELKLPTELEPLLRGLVGFLQASAELRARREAGAGEAELREPVRALRATHASLRVEALRRLPPRPESLSEHEAEQAFAAGVLLLPHYEPTVTSDLPAIDTVGSRTLADFRVDFVGGLEARRVLRSVLERSLGIAPEELAQVQLGLRGELAALEKRHALMLALDHLHPMRPGDPDLSRRAFRLFSALCPSHPYRQGEVGLVRTGTSLFLCLPLPPGPAWETARAARDAAGARALEEFARRCERPRQDDLVGFPAFGSVRGSEVEAGLLAALARAIDHDPRSTSLVLDTMVSVLPLDAFERYLVHDAWGHQWQAGLMRFEEAYREIATFGDMPALEREARDSRGRTLSFADALATLGSSLRAGERPDTGALDRFLLDEGTRRLARSATGLVAEVLADVVEYKFRSSRPEHARRLPCSSFMPELAAKLDLCGQDLAEYNALATAGFRRYVACESDRAGLAAALAARHPEWPQGLAREVAGQVGSRLARLLEWTFAPEPLLEADAGGLWTNLAGRIALQLLVWSSGTNDVLERLRPEIDSGRGVLRGPFDLFVLTQAAFFDRDPERNFWRLDELVTLRFEPCWRRLRTGLLEVEAGGGGRQ